MKGRIMRVENGKFYIITEKGDFVSADAEDGFECGDEVEVKNEVMPSYLKPVASIAAAVIIVFGGICGYHIPVRYVDVCINPEIQLSLNVFDRVVRVQGKNVDGRKIAAAKKLKNESVSSAVSDIVSSARTLGYMSDGKGSERDVIVSVFGSGAEELSKKIPLSNVRVIDESDCETAKRQDIPVGKYVLMNELAKTNANQSIEKLRDMSVKEIIDKLNEANQTPAPMPSPSPVPTAEPTALPEASQSPPGNVHVQDIQTDAPIAEVVHKPTIAPIKRAVTSSSKTVVLSSSKSKSNNTAKKSISTSGKSTSNRNTAAPSLKPASTAKPLSTIKPATTSKPTSSSQNASPNTSSDKVTRPSPNSSTQNSNDNGNGVKNNTKSENKNNASVKPSEENKVINSNSHTDKSDTPHKNESSSAKENRSSSVSENKNTPSAPSNQESRSDVQKKVQAEGDKHSSSASQTQSSDTKSKPGTPAQNGKKPSENKNNGQNQSRQNASSQSKQDDRHNGADKQQK